jgi:hypothetical protein
LRTQVQIAAKPCEEDRPALLQRRFGESPPYYVIRLFVRGLVERGRPLPIILPHPPPAQHFVPQSVPLGNHPGVVHIPAQRWI